MSTGAQPEGASRPDILERLSYHAAERFDMTLDDCLSFLAHGWLEVPGRSERELILQLLTLLAEAPSLAPFDLDATSRAFVRAHIEAERAQWTGEVTADVLAEVGRATEKFPTWPTDPLHALAVLGEEFGELTKAMLQFTYEPHKTSRGEIRAEAIQTAAMALRLAMSLDRYEYGPCGQHTQGSEATA